MKRRDLLKLVGVSGVLPFVGGRDESPKSEAPEQVNNGLPSYEYVGSASPRLPSGTAMFMGTPGPLSVPFDSRGDYAMWRLGVPPFDGDA